MARLSERDFHHRVRKTINDKLDEWFVLIPYEPDLCDEDLILTEIQAALDWIANEVEKEELQKP